MDSLEFQGVIDPRLDISNSKLNRTYGVLLSGSDQTWQPYPSSNFTSSNIQFTCNPPSSSIYVNRKVYLQISGTETFTGVTTGPLTTLLNASGISVSPTATPGSTNGSGDYDALRCLPISQMLNSFTVTIGNNTISQVLNQYSKVYQRISRNEDEEDTDLSMSPSMPDQSQQYVDLEGANLSPLRHYGVNVVQNSRGGFSQVEILDNVPGATSATVRWTITEPFWMSPFEFGRGQEKLALIGIENMSVSCTLGSGSGPLGNAVWSHSSSAFGGSSTITSSSVNITGATVFFNYITPDMTQLIPMPNEKTFYSYVSPILYPTAPFVAPLAPGASSLINMNSVQLQSIPNRIIVYVEQRPQDKTISSTDTFFRIDSISITFDNRSGLLAGASGQDLYQMSVRNGVNYSWDKWNRNVGSVLVSSFGLDIPLKSNQCPGMLGSRSLTMTVNITNISSSAMIPQLQVLCMQEGIMTVVGGNVVTNLGIIDEKELMRHKEPPFVRYTASQNVFGSGFWDDTLAFVKKALPQIAGVAHEVVKQVAPQYSGISGIAKAAVGGSKMRARDFRELIR